MNMKLSMFRYRLFRQKLLAALLVTILCLSVMFLSGYFYLSAQWVNSMQDQASGLYFSMELQLQAAESLVDSELERVYADAALLRDLHALLYSASEQEYIRARAANSLMSSELLRSFPEDVRMYVYRHAPELARIDLYGEKSVNSLSYLSSVTLSQYVPREQENLFREDIRQGITLWRTLRDPSNFQQKLGNGKAAFTFDCSKLFTAADFQNFRFAAVADQAGNILLLKGSTDDQEYLKRYLETGDPRYSMWESPFNRLFFYTSQSSTYNYRLITCMDDRFMRADNFGLLLFIALLLLGIGAVFILLYSGNLQYDAIFLTRILDVVKGVQEGEFRDAERPAHYRKNEYGMIAREIDEMSSRLNRHILTNYELRLKQQETEMRALQNQINPHFLYNTLEMIRAMAIVNQDTPTSEAIANLGALYREIVKRQDAIAIGDELALLQRYLKIMELKYPDRFFYQFEMPEEIKRLETIKFWMQPLAENFFQHGFDREGNFNLLIVSGEIRAESYRLQFIDNGATLSAEQIAELNRNMAVGETEFGAGGIGMNNVYTRLFYFYGKGFQMRIGNNKGNGVHIVIDIPKGRGE